MPALASFLALAVPSLGAGRAQETHTLLLPGPHPVGFASSWALDATRTWSTTFDGGATYGAEPAPRPVLVNLWYPARARDAQPAEPMAYGDYFELAGEGSLAALAQALGDHARGIFVAQVLGREEQELDADGLAELEELLAAPTGCRRDAPAAEGPFPLVLWHSGAQSSFEDDAPFCEYLASHGYVVAGSAFLDAKGATLDVDGGTASVEDLRFLVRHLGARSWVDATRVALAGHSLGAQAALRDAATSGCAARALVLFDTTLDYYGLALPLFGGLVDILLAGAEHVEPALLAFAGPEAQFQLLDRMVKAERTYVTVPGMDHDDFIAQGHERRRVLEGRADRAVGSERSAEVRGAPELRARYAAACEAAREFLDAELQGRREPFARKVEALGATTLGDDTLHAERAPRGTSAPPDYDPESALAPTPRQLARLIEQHDAALVCAVLARHRGTRPASPIYASTMLTGSLLMELLSHDRADEARALYACVHEFQPEVLGLFEFLADMSLWSGHPDRARTLLELARGLEPERAGILERLRRLDAPAEAPR